ncbi:type II toxin-antitoxin system death-on-curing family toxin [Sphingomonas sp.]|uniref:type II toxin-antitoxin system death-on-curing family toxin n=1 Tax=Sphingomonas sp. TaxID=28214 RepID=UPI0025E0C1B0|nr:type II toxin-antitoxin system death-on-curing family toxin [Sphingomonas sp.]
MSWIWIGIAVAEAVHDRQLAEHGGAEGVRDKGALESALARPQNLAAYEEPDAAALAAAYAYGVARNHPYVDGNKRTAWVLARLFLAANNIGLGFSREAAIQAMLALAAGELSEDELADWFRERIA